MKEIRGAWSQPPECGAEVALSLALPMSVCAAAMIPFIAVFHHWCIQCLSYVLNNNF